jgi:hypothetical protein
MVLLLLLLFQRAIKTKKRNEKLRKKNVDDKNIWREWLQKGNRNRNYKKRRRKQNEGRSKRRKERRRNKRRVATAPRRRRSKRRVVALLLLLLLVKGVARPVVAAIRVPRQ